jgi:2-dehydro-3-deoxygalactonokinase
MYYVTIDCGTTNSRAYVVNETGEIISKATKKVGVKDTATTGSRETLHEGVREIVREAIAEAGLSKADISAILSSGMITSEIGLKEIPHLTAPIGVDALAEHLTLVEDVEILGPDVPVYFVRGIKNQQKSQDLRPTQTVGELDFMRGEETQVAGMFTRTDFETPVIVVILSSHTKFIPINREGQVLGSLTTMSGQLYEAILEHTFVSKSVRKPENGAEKPEGYFNPEIVNGALDWINKTGLVRTLMFPRFLDVLLDTAWYERLLFFESLIAAEDMLAIGQLDLFNFALPTNFILVGNEERCQLYSHILKQRFPESGMQTIMQAEEIDALSIKGILSIARKAGVVK